MERVDDDSNFSSAPCEIPHPAPGPGLNQQQSGSQQYQQPPPFTGGRDVPPGPYAWRPGPTTELEKPTRPPDVKQEKMKEPACYRRFLFL